MRQPLRARIIAVVALISALILSACGAEVNTQLTLQHDYSGQRQFVLTMADNDAEQLNGGVEAAEQALQTHIPEVLSFDGIESEDEGYSATFTMDFDDVDEYRDNITTLLDASDVPEADREMDINITEQQLVTSIAIEEEFYNDDLMGWSANALLEEEVVSDNTTVLTSTGVAAVTFDGRDVDTSSSLPRIHFNLTDDRRFEDIGMDVEILESEAFHVTMSYLVSSSDTTVQNEFVTERVRQLNDLDGVEGAVEDSGATENHDSGNVVEREIDVTFSDPEAVEQGMQILLANDQATFEVSDTVDEASPDVITQYSGSNWTCETICNTANIRQLDGETQYPDTWQLVDQRREDGEFYLEFNRGMPLDSLTSTTRLGLSGNMSQSFEFVITDATFEEHEQAVADRFEPAEGTGSFTTSQENGKTVYTATFEAEDATALANQLGDYFEDKGVSETVELHHDPLTGLWAQYDLNVDLSAIWNLATGGVENAAAFQIELPPMHSGESGTTESTGGTLVLDESSGQFRVAASGPTTTTIWAVAIIAVLIVLALVTFLQWRRRKRDITTAKTPTDAGGTKPYNVQRSNDALTESQILRSPVAPGAFGGPTAKTTDVAPPADPKHTRIYDDGRPFPDVPLPSATDYQESQSAQDTSGNVAPSWEQADHDDHETTDEPPPHHNGPKQ